MYKYKVIHCWGTTKRIIYWETKHDCLRVYHMIPWIEVEKIAFFAGGIVIALCSMKFAYLLKFQSNVFPWVVNKPAMIRPRRENPLSESIITLVTDANLRHPVAMLCQWPSQISIYNVTWSAYD